MSDNALVSYDSQLEVGADLDHLASVGECIEIMWSGGPVTAVKTSHLQTASHIHTFKPGFADAGEASFKCNYLIADYEALVELVGEELVFKLTLSDGSFITGTGFLNKFPDAQVPEDDRILTNCGFKLSGPIDTDDGT